MIFFHCLATRAAFFIASETSVSLVCISCLSDLYFEACFVLKMDDNKRERCSFLTQDHVEVWEILLVGLRGDYRIGVGGEKYYDSTINIQFSLALFTAPPQEQS